MQLRRRRKVVRKRNGAVTMDNRASCQFRRKEDRRGGDEEEDACGSLHEALGKQPTDHLHVVRHARHELARARGVKESEGLGLDMIVQPLLEVARGALAVDLHEGVPHEDETRADDVRPDNPADEEHKQAPAAGEVAVSHGGHEHVVHEPLDERRWYQRDGNNENRGENRCDCPPQVRAGGLEYLLQRRHGQRTVARRRTLMQEGGVRR